MKFPLFLLVALVIAGGAQAQAMYKCTTAEGKTAFSDAPCPGQRSGNAANEKKPTTLTAAERRVVAANLGMRETDIMALEASCTKGLPGICAVLQEYRAKSATQMTDEAVMHARLACSQGDSASCNALALDARSQRDSRGEARNALIVRYSGECSAGDPRACRKLSDLSPR
jgi:hypothetical protein